MVAVRMTPSSSGMMDGKGDHAELLPPVGAVERPGGLVEFRIDALQARHEDDDRVAEAGSYTQDEHEDRRCAVQGCPASCAAMHPSRSWRERCVDGTVLRAVRS